LPAEEKPFVAVRGTARPVDPANVTPSRSYHRSVNLSIHAARRTREGRRLPTGCFYGAAPFTRRLPVLADAASLRRRSGTRDGRATYRSRLCERRHRNKSCPHGLSVLLGGTVVFWGGTRVEYTASDSTPSRLDEGVSALVASLVERGPIGPSNANGLHRVCGPMRDCGLPWSRRRALPEGFALLDCRSDRGKRR